MQDGIAGTWEVIGGDVSGAEDKGNEAAMLQETQPHHNSPPLLLS